MYYIIQSSNVNARQANNYDMKIYTFIIFTLFSSQFFSQNNFEYSRTWGTYFGANGGQTAGVYTNKGILFDSQRNMHIRGNIWNISNYGNAYFNQFLVGGGNSYVTHPGIHLFETRITPGGMLSYYGYSDHQSSTLLEKIDSQDNRYYISHGVSPAIQATAGVYLSNDPQPSSPSKIILAKYSPSGTLLWASYLPSTETDINIEIDEADNLYISGTTTLSTNLSTPGVLQEDYDFIPTPTGQFAANGYLLKISPGGQRIWATYMPSGVATAMKYHNGSLYMISGSNTNPALNTMATPGAFQGSPSSNSITKMNAANGTKQWGTYYGPASSTGLAVLVDLDVNETGVYIAGTDYNYDGTSFFGTPSSYKQYVTGGSDIFLSKFSLSGDREWSTYFGSSAEDMNEFDKVIAVNGNDIYITGNTYGIGNNIATPGAYQETPEINAANYYNFYFAKFNSSGNLVWSSYYGGSTILAQIVVPINVAFNNNTLYLYGSTNSHNGYSMEGAWLQLPNPANTNDLTCFIARFDNKNLSISENEVLSDLVLFNNPNNGNFTLRGKVLATTDCIMKIYDMSGRMIISRKLNNENSQYFEMQNLLRKGNYIIEISAHQKSLKTFKMTVH